MVGGFVVVFSVALIWGGLWISAGGAPQRVDHYLVYMSESVSGLNADAPLKFRGVDVGKVQNISIDTKNPERIRLLLQVRQGTPISEDTVATLEYQGLTGLANINLIGGRVDSQPLLETPGEEYPVIVSRPSLFARLDATMSDLLTNLIQTSASINALLNENNRAQLSRSIDNTALLTDRLAKQSGQLDEIFAHLNATLENAHTASKLFPDLVQEFSASAEAITEMADQVRRVGESLATASAGVERAVMTSDDGLAYFTGTTLPEISAMVAELRMASENLRRASDKLAQDPSVLLYGTPAAKRGPGE